MALKFQVIVNEDWCKGCNICVEYCPTNVLELKDAKATVIAEEKCIGCNICEYRCPDFAITVNKIEIHEKMEVTVG